MMFIGIGTSACPEYNAEDNRACNHYDRRFRELCRASAEIFHVRLPVAIFPSAEIEEVPWLDPTADIDVPRPPHARITCLPLAAGSARPPRDDRREILLAAR